MTDPAATIATAAQPSLVDRGPVHRRLHPLRARRGALLLGSGRAAGHRPHVLHRVAVLHGRGVPAVPRVGRRRSRCRTIRRTTGSGCGRRGTWTGSPVPCSSPAPCGSTGARGTPCASTSTRPPRTSECGDPTRWARSRSSWPVRSPGWTPAARSSMGTQAACLVDRRGEPARVHRLRRLGGGRVRRAHLRRRLERRGLQPRHARRRDLLPHRGDPVATAPGRGRQAAVLGTSLASDGR